MLVAHSKRYSLPLAAAALLGVVAWAYWPTFLGLAEYWEKDPQYSHGFIVPLFAVVILALRKQMLWSITPWPTWWCTPCLILGAAGFLFGSYIFSPWLTQISLLPVLLGVVLALGGIPLLRWSWPGLLFLVFMIPLPFRIDQSLTGPLQRMATMASTNALQTFGIYAQSEGKIIVLPDGFELGVVEACSGLRMLMVFVATSVAVAMLIDRSLLQRFIIVVSSVPIALFCNVARITVTGILHETVGHQAADYVYHDLAGWLMSPMAVLILCVELWLLRRLFVQVQPGLTPLALQKRSISALGNVAFDKAGSLR
jgi:exosortase